MVPSSALWVMTIVAMSVPGQMLGQERVDLGRQRRGADLVPLLRGHPEPHQREVLERVAARAKRWPARSDDIGCRGACAHLLEKGAIEIAGREYGPRGGEVVLYRVTDAGLRAIGLERQPATDSDHSLGLAP